MRKPVIGIFLDINQNSEKYSYAALPWYALRECYARNVEAAGGVPIMLPYNHDIDSTLGLIDGLVIPGCDEDINPRFYGEDVSSVAVKTKDIRTVYEMEFVKRALSINLPIFGICNGLQLINIIFGGTLIQHIPDTYPTDINHEQPAPKNLPTHLVRLQTGTLMSSLSPDQEIKVNSTHHQAIKKLGDGLVASAIAPDGIVEGVESNDYKFLAGVQWHAEYANTELDCNLFKRLVEAAR